MDAWSVFEAALDADGARRSSLLVEAGQRLDAYEGYSGCEREVLKACVAAVAAGDGVAPMRPVLDEVELVSRRCGSGWPAYYLAESAARLGRHEIVLSALSLIDRGFFENRDLLWRSARCTELHTIALLRSAGDLAKIEKLVSDLGSLYATKGDVHDFAPPTELVEVLVAAVPTTSRALELLTLSLDLEAWLDPGLAKQVEAALGAK